MPTTETRLDARAALNGLLSSFTHMFVADIGAIPDDKWDATYGGCTRSAKAMSAEVVSLLYWTADAMRGNANTSDAAYMESRKSDCATKAEAQAAVRAASEEFAAALAGVSEETLLQVVTPPWKVDAPLFAIAHIAVSHLWYHDGQLNYIQCLLGDEKIHWFPG
jgi:hypothetical protein